MSCKKNHSGIATILAGLSSDQGGVVRHKCAGCAYDQGFADGKENKPNNLDINVLPDNQGKESRHKSPTMAYNKGYKSGYAKRKATTN